MTTSLREHVVETKAGNELEMADIARDEFEVVMAGGGSDLQIRVRENAARGLEFGADLSEDLSNREIVRWYRDGQEDALLDVL